MARLKKEGLLPENLIKWETKKLEELLVPVSFYRVSTFSVLPGAISA